MKESLKEHTTHGTMEYPFTVYHIQKYPHTFSFPLHWHNELEIIYVQKGHLHLTIEQKSYEGYTGDIFFINSQEIHEMSVDNLETIYGTILFPLDSLLFQNHDIVNREFLTPLSEQKLKFATVLSRNHAYPEIVQCIRNIVEMYYGKEPAYQLGIRMELLHLIYQLYQNGNISQVTKEVSFSNLHREILSYIQDHYTTDISLEEVATRFHMSPKYFSRYFHTTFRITLSDYINRLRLDLAINLLENTDLTITEIALQCGYSSCSYFNKRFKEIYQISPSTYRKDPGVLQRDSNTTSN